MVEIFSDPRQKEHIANLGKKPEAPQPPSEPVRSELQPGEEVIDVEATPLPKIVARGGKQSK